MAMFGTVLGIEWFGHMLPWDDDIDLAFDKAFTRLK